MMETVFQLFCAASGVFFLFYFVRITLHCGHIPDFGWFWSGGGLLFLAAAWFSKKVILPDWVYAGSMITAMLLLLLFAVSFWKLSKAGGEMPKENADYLILLGAGVNGTVPSKALMARIRAAADYLLKNPDTRAILCGGQGYKEDVTEAFAMEQALITLGIQKERLLLEDKSTTTLENIAFASRYIEDKSKQIVIVTSDFHTIRGRRIAREAGFLHVETIGAPSSSVMRLHYDTRETLSWIKFGVRKLRQNGRKK